MKRTLFALLLALLSSHRAMLWAESEGVSVPSGKYNTRAVRSEPKEKPSRKEPAAPPVRVKESHKIQGLLDLNSATVEELMDLPGIGRSVAQKIISGRPYESRNGLAKKKILTDAGYQRIRAKVIVMGDVMEKKKK